MRIRPYVHNDWAAVCQIYNLAKPDELLGAVDPNAILRLEADSDMQALFRGSDVFVAEDSARVVGFGGNRGSFITWLFVHPSFRRNGIATSLVRFMLGRLAEPVTLNVMSGNVSARALYERIGFKVEREFQGHFQGNPCNVAKLIYETAA